jgi:lipopolysaccharide transport system permease protein
MTHPALRTTTDLEERPRGTAELPVIIIRPSEGWIPLDLRELWEYWDLLSVLIWRGIRVRYKQTVIGGAWALLQPLLSMGVLSVLFGHLVRVPSEGVPYPLFVLSALVPWTYFTHALTKASHSLVAHRMLLTKVYFPRLIIPLAAVLAGFVDFLIAFLLLPVLMLYYGVTPTAAILTLPLFILLAIATALGVGLWLATVNVAYRDVANALPFLTQLWFFATPVAYPGRLLPEPWHIIFGLNPMAGVVEGFRWALLGHTPHAPGSLLAVSALAVAGVLVGGLYYFRRKEDTFADVV